ncbi:MAG: NUDIX domain-containing protein [Planctomycetia bacterium]|nr:NUDIX domain-containing protein [Planctomycetia bacterium]
MTESMFLKRYDVTKYERPSLTVDVVIFTVSDRLSVDGPFLPEKELKILLIKRGKHPYKNCWALPGGFVQSDETLAEAAARELAEETGLQNLFLRQLYTWGDPGRDPRTWVVSCSYMALAEADKIKFTAPGDDAAEALWFTITKTFLQDVHTEEKNVRKQNFVLHFSADTIKMEAQMENVLIKTGKIWTEEGKIRASENIAFDHAKIINYALERLRQEIWTTDIIFNLMPEIFTLTQLRRTYEAILGRKIRAATFYRKMKKRIRPTSRQMRPGMKSVLLFQKKQKNNRV